MVPVPPPLLSPPLCTLPPGPGPARFVCYCEEGVGAKGQGDFNLYVTDAAELWSTCFTPESLAALEDGASLTVSRGPLALDLNLSKVPGPEAATRLQALTLGLAERVCSLERRLTGGIGGGYPAASLGAPFPCLHSWLFSQLQRRPLPAPGRALGWWGLSNSYQTRILREAFLDLASGGGVLESPSSTLASRVRNQPVV
ncbi:protein PAXX isoform X4 [Rhinolophus sinicus]|uniref:protein PAXX isoform X4 n=1 Tax=Rhinolophus sinicus TaxID=89399 RepID=UPI003D78C9A4